jgi:hypothetical protein
MKGNNMNLFVCSFLAGCHLPLYKTYGHFVRANNSTEAKQVMRDYIKESKTDTVFFVDKMKRVDEEFISLLREKGNKRREI